VHNAASFAVKLIHGDLVIVPCALQRGGGSVGADKQNDDGNGNREDNAEDDAGAA